MKYVIIGAGAAGITAAKTIRGLQPEASITIISEDTRVHSRCMLHRYLSHERDEAGISFIPEDFFEENSIRWLAGKKAEHISTDEKAVSLASGEKVPYDKLLIASGANSFIPPVGDFRTAENVFGLRHLSDAVKIRAQAEDAEKILIVGSGLVGMDAAYAFLEQKKEVTVVEMADRILPIQLDEKAGAAYRKLFEEQGCRFITGKSAARTVMDADNRITSVFLSDDTEIPCDLVIVAAGVRSAIECVNNSSVKAERFIEVNDYLQTSDQDVYAAGDVTGLSGIWPNAQKQGQTAAYNMCGFLMQYIDRYAMKNTMNFYGLTTLSLGRGTAEEGDEVIVYEDRSQYKRAIIRNGCLDSILIQGSIDYTGIYQYLIKNQIDITDKKDHIFDIDFAEYFGIEEDGQYSFA